jgi:glycosyltransferase involved in cell wall biosynthesis
MIMSPSLLILCPDFMSERMAGPAIRYWEFAKILATSYSVTLAIPNEVPHVLPEVTSARLIQHTPENIVELAHRHDIILFQGYIFDRYPFLRQLDKILIADMYDPIVLEGLEQVKSGMAVLPIPEQIRTVNDQLKIADYFLCASERQRDLWLGHLLTLGRINTKTYQQIQQRVITIPFGLPDQLPQRTRPESSLTNDFTLIWGGGLWEWFDPLTVIRAVHRLLPRYPYLKLLFLGTQHPNPTIPKMPMQQRAEDLARELGLYDQAIIFQPGWVPYRELSNYLLTAQVGVSAHFATLETHFSFRTRLLYYLWVGKPIITTEGDVLAQEIAQATAGIVVKAMDEDGWVTAIEQLHDDHYYQTCANGVKKLAQRYRWSRVVEPLRQQLQSASLAPDMRIENGLRMSTVWNCEQEYHQLRQYLEFIERSHSWKITAPLRAVRRWLGR